MPDEVPHVLLLGGTTEAVALAQAVAGGPWRLTYSLAGRATPRRPPPGRLRTGGFGGVEGLAAFLGQERVAAVIDATHPFAARISHHARLACESVGCPRLVLRRPQWVAQEGDRWVEAASLEDAAPLAARLGRHALLTLGTADLAPFAAQPELRCTLRSMLPMPPPFPGCAVIVGRGPFGEAEEMALFTGEGFDVLVTKASGGSATEAKLSAARRLGLPVVMIRRPPVEPGPVVDTPAEAQRWLDRVLGRRDNRSTLV